MSLSELLSVLAHFITEKERESNYFDLSSNCNAFLFFQFHNTDYHLNASRLHVLNTQWRIYRSADTLPGPKFPFLKEIFKNILANNRLVPPLAYALLGNPRGATDTVYVINKVHAENDFIEY